MNTMRGLRIFGLMLVLLSGASVDNTIKAQPGVSISFQTFYNDLSPYGRWMRNPQYGSVWIPDVPQGFQPYSTNGYWEVTEYGNTWVSDYDWGWAPFHYGRWSFDDYVGWFWVPDYEWGPAWVNWRSGGGYYGWAPLGPGINVNVSVNIPSFWWVFVPQQYITSPRWNYYCAPRNRVSHYYNQTVIINNYYRSNNRTYVYGPRRDEIERVTRRNVPVRTIDASPGGRGRVIVANSGRGNDRYDVPSNARDYRNNGRGATIDAGSRDRNDSYNNRGSRTNDSYNDRTSRGNDDLYNNRGNESYNNRSNRGSDGYNSRSDRSNDAYNRPDAGNLRNNDRRDSPAPNVPDRSNDRFNRSPVPDRSSIPDSRSERSSERMQPTQRNRDLNDQIQRAERNNGGGRIEQRSQPQESRPERSQPDFQNRGSRESGGRSSGASERSSRSPR